MGLSIGRDTFGFVEERKVYRYRLENSKGMVVSVISFGGIITDVLVPDSSGNIRNVILGFETLEEYVRDTAYLGATVGRFANRIKGGRFSIDGKEYLLSKNAGGKHHIHGGLKGFSKVVWDSSSIEGEDKVGVVLEYFSRDGEEGYPGNLRVKVVYSLTEDNEVIMEYFAKTNTKTLVNLTNHSYWNLNGRSGGKKIYNHILQINSSEYLEVDEDLIPTGRLLPVEGTPLDFRKPKEIGRDIAKLGNGYDHCYVITGSSEKLIEIANVISPESGISMRVLTTMPGIQFYSGNFLTGRFEKHQAFCLETEFFPDSPNKPNFPNCILASGEEYNHKTVHIFD